MNVGVGSGASSVRPPGSVRRASGGGVGLLLDLLDRLHGIVRPDPERRRDLVVRGGNERLSGRVRSVLRDPAPGRDGLPDVPGSPALFVVTPAYSVTSTRWAMTRGDGGTSGRTAASCPFRTPRSPAMKTTHRADRYRYRIRSRTRPASIQSIWAGMSGLSRRRVGFRATTSDEELRQVRGAVDDHGLELRSPDFRNSYADRTSSFVSAGRLRDAPVDGVDRLPAFLSVDDRASGTIRRRRSL